MLITETREIAQREQRLLEDAIEHKAPVVTVSGTAKWILVWFGGLCVLGLLGLALASLVTSLIVAVVFAALLALAAIVCVYAIIMLVTSYRHWSRIERRFWREDAPEIRTALAEGKVRVARVKASAVVTIEEYEEEGAGFVFDVGDGKLVFLKGQRYWPAEDGQAWPNSDFEIVRTVIGNRWVGIFCNGEHLQPVKVLQTSDCRDDLVWDEREETVDAGLLEFARSIRRTSQQDD